jgi:hypothetical protein
MRSSCARRTGSASTAGSGTAPFMVVTASGLVPQVTIGAMPAASISITRS